MCRVVVVEELGIRVCTTVVSYTINGKGLVMPGPVGDLFFLCVRKDL